MTPSDIPTLMDRVLAYLHRLGRRSAHLLQPPLSDAELQSWQSRFPFEFTRELEAIYSWRNGTKADPGTLLDDLHMFPGFFFLSMEDAHRTYLERKDGPQWQEEWFPLFSNDAGDFYLVPCCKQKVQGTEVIGFVHGEPEQVPEYESVAAMAATLDAAFAEGVFFIDQDDTLEMDDDKYKLIARRFNPGIREWQS